MGTHPIFESDFDCLTADDSLETLSGDDPSWVEEHKRNPQRNTGLTSRTFTVPGRKKRTRTEFPIEKSRACSSQPARPLAPLMPLMRKPVKRVEFASQVETKLYCVESSQDSELLSQDLENVCFVQADSPQLSPIKKGLDLSIISSDSPSPPPSPILVSNQTPEASQSLFPSQEELITPQMAKTATKRRKLSRSFSFDALRHGLKDEITTIRRHLDCLEDKLNTFGDEL